MQSKHVTQSTSTWGAVVLIVPIVMQMFGAPLDAAQTEQVQQAGHALDSVMMQVMVIIGAAQMLIGRFSARQPLHIIPGNTYVIEPDGTKRYLKPKLIKPVAKVPDDIKQAMDAVMPKEGAP